MAYLNALLSNRGEVILIKKVMCKTHSQSSSHLLRLKIHINSSCFMQFAILFLSVGPIKFFTKICYASITRPNLYTIKLCLQLGTNLWLHDTSNHRPLQPSCFNPMASSSTTLPSCNIGPEYLKTSILGASYPDILAMFVSLSLTLLNSHSIYHVLFQLNLKPLDSIALLHISNLALTTGIISSINTKS